MEIPSVIALFNLGEPDAAMATLNRLYELPGFYSEVWIAREPWFANLRALPGYRNAAARWATRRGDALLGGGSGDR